MAKREMTEEQKKLAAERLAAAREAKKAKTAESVPAEEEATAPPSDVDIEREARDTERATKEAMFNDEMIPFILPLDPGNEQQDQVFARSFNGFIINIKRGERVILPRKIVRFIESCERIQRESDAAAAEYTTRNGKML